MMRALIFAAGAAAGFVAGTRAGRETYDKMRGRSNELWHNPAVQEKVSGAAAVVKEKAPQVQETVGALADKAAHRGQSGSGQHAADKPASPVAETKPATDEPTRPPAAPGETPRSPE
ncbi:YtxH domain-containing protein [Rhodococcus sp. CH91]|uniref:YtxH domain-containing protein n=1 Tax=Rhodococcus sp. CH91 TaxID=2910256 RepID=UPI001F4A85AE|nr:YtxH domain-containing protein [Rhodococcus sp. CH91]